MQNKLFLKPAKGKNGKTYWKGYSKKGRMKCSLFEANGKDGTEFVVSLSYPQAKKRKTYRRAPVAPGIPMKDVIAMLASR